jgi:hypothetical protein
MKKIIKYKKWEKIPWNSIQIDVYDLQNKIFYHAKNDKIKKKIFGKWQATT